MASKIEVRYCDPEDFDRQRYEDAIRLLAQFLIDLDDRLQGKGRAGDSGTA